jgi:hypothetical protein
MAMTTAKLIGCRSPLSAAGQQRLHTSRPARRLRLIGLLVALALLIGALLATVLQPHSAAAGQHQAAGLVSATRSGR